MFASRLILGKSCSRTGTPADTISEPYVHDTVFFTSPGSSGDEKRGAYLIERLLALEGYYWRCRIPVGSMVALAGCGLCLTSDPMRSPRIIQTPCRVATGCALPARSISRTDAHQRASSGKSTASKMVRRLDWTIFRTSTMHCLISICRIATGQGFATRQLYSDDDNQRYRGGGDP
jgi:hypothetical protein